MCPLPPILSLHALAPSFTLCMLTPTSSLLPGLPAPTHRHAPTNTLLPWISPCLYTGMHPPAPSFPVPHCIRTQASQHLLSPASLSLCCTVVHTYPNLCIAYIGIPGASLTLLWHSNTLSGTPSVSCLISCVS